MPSPVVDVAQLRYDVQSCTACPAHLECRLPVPPAFPFGGLDAEGKPPVRVLVVGRNPGRTEDEVGEPFVGASGRELNKWLQAAGLSREWETAITNLVKCYTLDNRPPSKNEIDTCKSIHLARELSLLRPQLLVGFGTQVRDALSSHDEFPRAVDHTPGRIATFFTYHPSAILRSARFRNRWYKDAETVKRWLQENPC